MDAPPEQEPHSALSARPPLTSSDEAQAAQRGRERQGMPVCCLDKHSLASRS